MFLFLPQNYLIGYISTIKNISHNTNNRSLANNYVTMNDYLYCNHLSLRYLHKLI